MSKYNLAVLGAFFFLASCHQQNELPAKYMYLQPRYDLVRLECTADTLHISLDDDTYNDVRSLNVFGSGNDEYLAFYEGRSQSINIFCLKSRLLRRKFFLTDLLHGSSLYKTTVHCRSFDSIFVNNNATLFLLDSNGRKRNAIDFLPDPSFAWGIFDNVKPPVFKGEHIYVGVRTNVKETSFKELKKWKVLYDFDLHNNNAKLCYNLPKFYHENYYGRRLLECSYCVNSEGRFVFSFAADTVIYETNLIDYHVAHYAKSHLQEKPILPVEKQELLNDEGFKNYLIRDSYGAIYFDQFTERYLRVVREKIEQNEYEMDMNRKRQRIIIFDKDFKIIGESPVDDGISLNTIFFTKEGYIYARTKIEDEYTLHFVRLIYKTIN